MILKIPATFCYMYKKRNIHQQPSVFNDTEVWASHARNAVLQEWGVQQVDIAKHGLGERSMTMTVPVDTSYIDDQVRRMPE